MYEPATAQSRDSQVMLLEKSKGQVEPPSDPTLPTTCAMGLGIRGRRFPVNSREVPRSSARCVRGAGRAALWQGIGGKRCLALPEARANASVKIGMNKCARESGVDRRNFIRTLIRGIPLNRNSYKQFLRWLNNTPELEHVNA